MDGCHMRVQLLEAERQQRRVAVRRWVRSPAMPLMRCHRESALISFLS